METVAADLAALEDVCRDLEREPDFDAPELQAYDAADLLIVHTAADRLRAAGDAGAAAGDVAVIGDRHGAMTLLAATVYGVRGIRVHQDPVLAERALARNAERVFHDRPERENLDAVYRSHPLDAGLLRGARTVLVQLPRALDALREIAALIAAHAAPDVRVYAGGRDKHMSRSMNEVLAEYFSTVEASRGWRKSRVLTATAVREDLLHDAVPSEAVPREAVQCELVSHEDVPSEAAQREPVPPADGPATAFPRWGSDPDLDFDVAAFGATFGGATLDHGSRLLLQTLRDDPPERPQRIVDLGCGNGVLAVSAARAWPEAEIIATDQSSAATRATRLTAARAGVQDRITVVRADGTERVPEDWADLVLLNPPFHSGATVHEGVGARLIRHAATALAPGGELRLVFNSHLGYRSLLRAEFATVRQLARTKTYTVLAATTATTATAAPMTPMVPTAPTTPDGDTTAGADR